MARSLGSRPRLLLAVALVLVAWIPPAGAATGNGAASTVRVPPVTGGLLAAYARLHGAGLRVTIPRRITLLSSAPPAVLRAVPAPGRRVARGSIVTLTLGPTPGRLSVRTLPVSATGGPDFSGAVVSRAYAWAVRRHLLFRAELGPLTAGARPGLLDDYRTVAQRPRGGAVSAARDTVLVLVHGRARRRVRPFTVWGIQPAPVAPKPAPPKPPPPPPHSPPPPPAPSAGTGGATVYDPATATVTGLVDPNGSATSYYFDYGTSTAYGSQTALSAAGAGSAQLTVEVNLSGLAGASTYHYRIVAVSPAGTSYGADSTFLTPGYWQNPIYSASAFPDPFVLDNGGAHDDYWAYGTGNLFPMLHSTDLVHWTPAGTAMTVRPAWASTASDWHPWAPSVISTPGPCPGASTGGCYVMYYVALDRQGVNCIGVATSPSPAGPFADQGPLDVSAPPAGATPLGCGDANGKGNIDPSPFLDATGQPYLYVSTDNVCTNGACTWKPTISAIPLSADLLHASGPRVPLISGDPGTWEAAGAGTATVEGPSMELHDGTYYLFYSGGSWWGAYAMGYATGPSPTGPFTKAAANPILTGNATALGPGGGDALVTGPAGGLWMVYAARASSYSAPRTLRIDSFRWTPSSTAGAPDVPVIAGPSFTPQGTQP